MDQEQTNSSTQTVQQSPPIKGPLQRHTHTYDLMRQCIHCGFCLPTCPTYAVLGVEMDSPRGRIYQMQAVAEGKLEVSDNFIEHMYCCVGCRACETACPSGVQFGKLIEAAREHIQIETQNIAAETGPDREKTPEYAELLTPTASRNQGSLSAKLLRRFFFDTLLPSRTMLTLVFGGLKVYQRSGIQKAVHATRLFKAINSLPTPFQGKLTIPEELMDGAKGSLIPGSFSEVTPAIGPKRYRVGFISGCIMDQVFHDINEATIRVLAANGCEVITPPQQGCCGALHVHGGEAERGRALARQNIDAFAPYNCDFIIINSAGCGSTLKEYDHLLRDDPAYAERAREFTHKMKDISEFLMNIERTAQMGEIAATVAYHDACHLLHGQKIKTQPRDLLKSIPGIRLVDLKEADWCCGSAGIYNLTNQEMGRELLERKMGHISATGAQTIATGNPGCMMQIALGARQRGMKLDVVHPLQLLDQAYQSGGAYGPHAQQVQPSRSVAWPALFAGLGVTALIMALLLRRKRS